MYTPRANVLMWVCFLENLLVFEATLPRPRQLQPMGDQDGGNGQVLIPEKAERTEEKGKRILPTGPQH